MRLTNFIQFSKCKPEKLPTTRDTPFKYCHVNRDDLMNFRKMTKLYEKENSIEKDLYEETQ